MDEAASKVGIREVIERWAVWRDAGDWDRFAEVWHSDGYMTATWFQGSFRDFIAVSRARIRSWRADPALSRRQRHRRAG